MTKIKNEVTVFMFKGIADFKSQLPNDVYIESKNAGVQLKKLTIISPSAELNDRVYLLAKACKDVKGIDKGTGHYLNK